MLLGGHSSGTEGALDEHDPPVSPDEHDRGRTGAVSAGRDEGRGEQAFPRSPDPRHRQLVVGGLLAVGQEREEAVDQLGGPAVQQSTEGALRRGDLGPGRIQQMIAESVDAGLERPDVPLAIGIVEQLAGPPALRSRPARMAGASSQNRAGAVGRS